MPCVFPGAGDQGGRFVSDGSGRGCTGLAYTAGWCCPPGAGCHPRAAGESLGAFSWQSGRGRHAGGVVHDRSEPGGLFEFGNLLPSRVASLQAKTRRSILLSGVLAARHIALRTAPFMARRSGTRSACSLQAL
jgi:thiol:disulfide interchange protein DsbD